MQSKNLNQSSSSPNSLKQGKFDRGLAIVVFALMIFGVVMISSASAINSFFNTKGASTQYYFWNQLNALVIALVAWLVVQKIPYRFWYKHRLLVLSFGILLLATVFTPLRSDSNTFARGWINIPFLPSIQPSELVKTPFIIYLAAFFDSLGPKIKSFKNGFLPFATIVGIFLIFLFYKKFLIFVSKSGVK